jgi:hypothetical protein
MHSTNVVLLKLVYASHYPYGIPLGTRTTAASTWEVSWCGTVRRSYLITPSPKVTILAVAVCCSLVHAIVWTGPWRSDTAITSATVTSGHASNILLQSAEGTSLVAVVGTFQYAHGVNALLVGINYVTNCIISPWGVSITWLLPSWKLEALRQDSHSLLWHSTGKCLQHDPNKKKIHKQQLLKNTLHDL